METNEKIKVKDTYLQVNEKNSSVLEIRNLMIVYGFKGLGIWHHINENLINNKGRLPLDYRYISDKKSDKTIIEDIINNFNLFVVEGDTYYSKDIQRQLEERGKESDIKRKNAKSGWDKRKERNMLNGISANQPIKQNDIKTEKSIKQTEYIDPEKEVEMFITNDTNDIDNNDWLDSELPDDIDILN